MSDTAKWYVVHTYSGYENKVATSIENAVENRKLHDLIQEIRVPTETVVEIKDDKKREVERKLFPSYVLVKMIMTDDSWYVVRNIRGVTGFVGPGSKRLPMKRWPVLALIPARWKSTSLWAIRSMWYPVTWMGSSEPWKHWTPRKTMCGSSCP